MSAEQIAEAGFSGTSPPLAGEDSAAAARAFIPSLEGLRGIAALVVLIFHVVVIGNENFYKRTINELHSLNDVLLRLVFAVFNGHIAVSVFFVLSGFVLALSLERDAQSGLAKSRKFAARRLLRIYPALVVNLLIIFASFRLMSTAGAPALSPRDLGMNLLLLDFKVNGATWTLLVEILAIPLLLLAYWTNRRFGLTGLIAILGISVAGVIFPGKVYAMLPWRDFLALAPAMQFVLYFITQYFLLFSLGILIAELYRRGMISISQRVANITLGVSLAAMLGGWLVFGYESRTALLVGGFGCAGLVGILALERPSGLRTFLDWGPVQFLGRISYSFYLFHTLSVVTVFTASPLLLQPFGFAVRSIEGYLVLVIAATAMTIPMAWASYVLIERPAMRLGHRF